MKNSFVVLVSVVDVVEVVEIIVDVVLVTVVDDVEMIVESKSNSSPVSLSDGSAKSIGPSWKSIDDKLSLLELLKCAVLSGSIATCVSFWSLVKLEFGVLVVFNGSSAEIEFLQNGLIPKYMHKVFMAYAALPSLRAPHLLLTVSMPFPMPRKKGLIRVPWTTTAVVATALLTFLTPGLITCSYACPVTPTTLSKGLANPFKKI